MTTGLVQTESRHAGGFMVSEAEGRRSRQQRVVALNQALVAGQVIGKIDVPAMNTSGAAADASNTGNGTLTLDATNPIASSAKNGVYRVVNYLVASGGGEFIVHDPDGIEIGRVAVGATFNTQIKFVIAHGSTDFAIGDAFSVTVAIDETDYQIAAFNPNATDGSQVPAGICWDNVTTDASNLGSTTTIEREAEVRGVDLIWPSGITAAQQTVAIRWLERFGIIVR